MDLMQPFLKSRTLGDVCDLLEQNKLSVAHTERAMGATRGTLEHKIKSRKFFAFFKERYPERFDMEFKPAPSPYRFANTLALVDHKIPCMVPGCNRTVTIQLMPGEKVPRGMRKRCERHNRAVGKLEAGCICTGGCECDQLSNW